MKEATVTRVMKAVKMTEGEDKIIISLMSLSSRKGWALPSKVWTNSIEALQGSQSMIGSKTEISKAQLMLP